jgi:hypothetical protein
MLIEKEKVLAEIDRMVKQNDPKQAPIGPERQELAVIVGELSGLRYFVSALPSPVEAERLCLKCNTPMRLMWVCPIVANADGMIESRLEDTKC